ncbi:MAG: glycosyltransferase family 2 protein [Clostridiales bacterium]|nr:glycosyltransferase family 2 protein [Clostridiales bacterium]
MDQEKVAVLLSAYNGEKYIKQQIDSILNQTWPNVELYVRDDGSTDGTLAILESYAAEGKLYLKKGENRGFVQSFLWLVSHAGEADYYAFSDQDDVWFEDKLSMAMERFRETDPGKPVLYFSNYDYYDGELNFVSHREGKAPEISFRNSLVDCVSLGFNSVFNRTARDVVAADVPEKCTGHDWWMYMICAGMGQVIYDERPTVKYRRHGNNVSDGGDSFLKFQIWRFKRFFLNRYFHHIHEQIQEYGELYGERLSEEDRKILRLFTADGFHPLLALRKVFYPKRFRQNLIDEIFIRCVFLIGRL